MQSPKENQSAGAVLKVPGKEFKVPQGIKEIKLLRLQVQDFMRANQASLAQLEIVTNNEKVRDDLLTLKQEFMQEQSPTKGKPLPPKENVVSKKLDPNRLSGLALKLQDRPRELPEKYQSSPIVQSPPPKPPRKVTAAVPTTAESPNNNQATTVSEITAPASSPQKLATSQSPIVPSPSPKPPRKVKDAVSTTAGSNNNEAAMVSKITAPASSQQLATDSNTSKSKEKKTSFSKLQWSPLLTLGKESKNKQALSPTESGNSSGKKRGFFSWLLSKKDSRKDLESPTKAASALQTGAQPIGSSATTTQGSSPRLEQKTHEARKEAHGKEVIGSKDDFTTSPPASPQPATNNAATPPVDLLINKKRPEVQDSSFVLEFMAAHPQATVLCMLLTAVGTVTALIAFGAIPAGPGFSQFLLDVAHAFNTTAPVMGNVLGSLGEVTAGVSAGTFLSMMFFQKPQTKESVVPGTEVKPEIPEVKV